MLLARVLNYEIFRPKMDTIRERLHSIATLADDISPAFPYINAELGGWDYDRKNQVLLLKLSAGKWITLHAREIAIRGARDVEESHALLEWIKGQINDIYACRDQITPRFTSQAALKVIEILKLLPMTNCKLCGYATCMAYATALREGEVGLKDCQPLWEEKYREKGKNSKPIWKATAGGLWTRIEVPILDYCPESMAMSLEALDPSGRDSEPARLPMQKA